MPPRKHILIGVLLASAWMAVGVSTVMARPSGGNLRISSTRHFRISHSLPEAHVDALGDILESLYDRYLELCHTAGFFARTPQKPLPWMYFNDAAQFLYHARPEHGVASADSGACYSVKDNCVFLFEPQSPGLPAGASLLTPEPYAIQRISHEMAHQLLYSSGLQNPGVMYPTWFSEGLATSFESDAADSGLFNSYNPWRAQRLVAAYRGNRLMSLAQIAVVTRSPVDETERLDFYAQAWGMIQFLYQQNPKAFRLYLHTLALRPPGKRPQAALAYEFQTAFGDFLQLERQWQEYLRNLAGTKVADL